MQDKHNQHKLQAMPTASASEVFTLIDYRKKHQHKLQRVETILGASRSRMQQPNTGITRARSGYGLCPLCKLQLVAESYSY